MSRYHELGTGYDQQNGERQELHSAFRHLLVRKSQYSNTMVSSI